VNRILLLGLFTLGAVGAGTSDAAGTPLACLGSLPLGKFRISVYRPDRSSGLPIKDVESVPAGSKLVWEPVHLSSRFSGKGEIAVLVVPQTRGQLITLPPRKVGQRQEWDLPQRSSVVALVLGPDGLNMNKVKSLIERNEDLLPQLANYAQQTSEVEALVQELADSERRDGGADAALRGFASRWGVALPKLDAKATVDQQAYTLLAALLPAASTYDPLAPTSVQILQTGGLAASVAGLFFGNAVGIAAGGTALVANLKAVLFPNTEFRSAFAQTYEGDALAFCAKNQPPKSRTRSAYLWAYRFPDLSPPVTAITGPAYVPLASKSSVALRTAEGSDSRHLSRARNWRLASLSGNVTSPVPVSLGSKADSLELDLTKANLTPGDYRLMADWGWDALSLGTLHIRPFGDFTGVHVVPASKDRLIQGNGVVSATLTGADFQFVQRVEIQKVAARPAKPVAIPFELPAGERRGEQRTLTVDIDTADAGAYRLLITQADGVEHSVPVTVLPPNPVISNLPLRVNRGESHQAFRLEGSGLDRLEALSSEAGTISGAPGGNGWSGQIRLGPEVPIGQRFPLRLKVRGVESPVVLPNAIWVVGPRPKILAARKSLSQEPGVEIRDTELPAGNAIGFVLSITRPDGAPSNSRLQLELGCRSGEARNPLTLTPGESAGGASLNFAGPDSLYLSLDPGVVGYPGCELVATVSLEPNGRSDAFSLGRVLRTPLLDQFTLTSESMGPNAYLGILKGRDLDVIEKAGWDGHHGLPVVGIPAPVPGLPAEQTLRITLPWPSPAPHSPLYIWLRGEESGRRTSVTN
jgi:hypothetical protein